MASSFQQQSSVPRKRGHQQDDITIDFTRNPSSEIVILPIPEDGDDLKTIAEKMSDIANVLDTDKSVAVATNFKGMARSKLDPVVIAMEGMTYFEREAFELWHSGRCNLPAMTWDTMKEEAFTGENTKKRNIARVEAIRLIYLYPHATGEHLAYITKHMEDTVLPLVRAVVRFENAKKDLRGGHDIDMEEWAEYQCLTQIQRTTARLQQELAERMKKLTQQLKASMDVLEAYEKTLRVSLEAQGISGVGALDAQD